MCWSDIIYSSSALVRLAVKVLALWDAAIMARLNCRQVTLLWQACDIGGTAAGETQNNRLDVCGHFL
jgi:hypothetical protein